MTDKPHTHEWMAFVPINDAPVKEGANPPMIYSCRMCARQLKWTQVTERLNALEQIGEVMMGYSDDTAARVASMASALSQIGGR